MRGGARNNKPTALRILEGNPGKRPLNQREPQPQPIADMKPPAYLDKEARACWRRNAPKLVAMGVLTDADVDEFILYCQAWSRYRTACALLAVASTFDYRQAAGVVERAEHAVRMLAAEFGMNPAARSRLQVAPKPETVDPMEEMLSGRKRTG